MATKKSSSSTAKKSTPKTTAKKSAPKKVSKPAKPVEPSPSADMELSAFIKEAYLAVLGRPADEGGLKHYMTAVEVHKESRESILISLKQSKEYKSKQ